MEITSQNNVTVLLSTHYIEEARQSNFVGLMRNGVQIAEDSPQNILQKMETTSLEEAFLRYFWFQLEPLNFIVILILILSILEAE